MKLEPEFFERVTNRLMRLNRLFELQAPNTILEMEYKWFMIEVERCTGAVNEIDIPYTEEQLECLREQLLFENIYEDDEDDDENIFKRYTGVDR